MEYRLQGIDKVENDVWADVVARNKVWVGVRKLLSYFQDSREKICQCFARASLGCKQYGFPCEYLFNGNFVRTRTHLKTCMRGFQFATCVEILEGKVERWYTLPGGARTLGMAAA